MRLLLPRRGGGEDSPLQRPRLVPHDKSDTSCLYILGGGLVPLGAFICYEALTSSGASDPLMDWVCLLTGFALAGPGLILLALGAVLARRLAHAKKSLGDLFEGAWLVDRWSPPEARDLLRGGIGLPLAIGVFSGLLMVPLTYVVIAADPGAGLLLLVLNLIPLGALGLVGYRLVRGIKFRDGWLRYQELPISAAEPIRLTYHAPAALKASVSSIEVVLRRVEQSFKNEEATGQGVQSEERSALRQSLQVASLEADHVIEFVLPEGAPGTNLHGKRVQFYELELSAEAEGIDYHAIYLLPIYRF